jgi:hypothetical protein
VNRRSLLTTAGVAAAVAAGSAAISTTAFSDPEPTPDEASLQSEIDWRSGQGDKTSPIDCEGMTYALRAGIVVPDNVALHNVIFDVSELAYGAAAVTVVNRGWGGYYPCPCGEKPDVWRNGTINEVLRNVLIIPLARTPSQGFMNNRTGVLMQSSASMTHTVSVMGLGKGMEHGRASWACHHVGTKLSHCNYGFYSDRTPQEEDLRPEGSCRTHIGRGLENTTMYHGYIDNCATAGVYLIKQDMHFQGMSIAHQNKHVIVKGGGHPVFTLCHFESSKERGHGKLPRIVVVPPATVTFRDCDIYAHGYNMWDSSFERRYFQGTGYVHRDWRTANVRNSPA